MSARLNILLVENSKTARAVMTKFLEGHNYTVAAAPNGAASIEAAKTAQFDLIIMDLYMPSMNGHEAARAIRALPGEESKVPIIILTASQEPKDEQLCKDAGVNEYILKSDHNQALLDKLNEYQSQKE